MKCDILIVVCTIDIILDFAFVSLGQPFTITYQITLASKILKL